MMPSPELVQFVRDSRKGRGKKGIFPRKNFRLIGKIEWRDSFNGVIQTESPKRRDDSPLFNEHYSKPKKEASEDKPIVNVEVDGVIKEQDQVNAVEEEKKEISNITNDPKEEHQNN